MDSRRQRRVERSVRLVIRAGADAPIEGWVEWDGAGGRKPFAGWLELLRLLELATAPPIAEPTEGGRAEERRGPEGERSDAGGS